MDTWQAIDKIRTIRKFTDEPLEPEHLDRILNAGRRAGSSKNTQQWDFVVCTDRAHLVELAEVGPYAAHLAGAAAAVALVVPDPATHDAPYSIMWDLGRAAQNMVLAAWELGIGSVPATVYRQDLARELLPTAETFTALSLVPQRAGPDDVRTLRDRLSHLHPLEHDALAGTTSGVRIDLEAHQVHVDGLPVRLTAKEFALLAHLVRAPHRVVGRAELLLAVWGGKSRPGTRTIDVHVRRLREKVTGSAVVTVRGIGYRFDPTPRIVLHGSGDAR